MSTRNRLLPRRLLYIDHYSISRFLCLSDAGKIFVNLLSRKLSIRAGTFRPSERGGGAARKEGKSGQEGRDQKRGKPASRNICGRPVLLFAVFHLFFRGGSSAFRGYFYPLHFRLFFSGYFICFPGNLPVAFSSKVTQRRGPEIRCFSRVFLSVAVFAPFSLYRVICFLRNFTRTGFEAFSLFFAVFYLLGMRLARVLAQ